ncbi:MAG: hypothetical protein MUC88_11375 [Planctomycetes bacterium]|nr:hypothetical protein [Planctomycetota bacterium]
MRPGRGAIDYCIARHACASGVKYALASLGSLQAPLISRPNEPDFSDLFALPEADYQKLLDQAAALQAADSNALWDDSGTTPQTGTAQNPTAPKDSDRKTAKKKARPKARKEGSRPSAVQSPSLTDVNEVNDVNDLDPNSAAWLDEKPPVIRGPYGPPWPLVAEPLEFEVGLTKLKIEIEDENAKYPLGWALIADDKLRAEAVVGWTTFCEWMGYQPDEMESLNQDLAKIGQMKPFKTEFKPESQAVEPPANLKSRITRPTTGSAAGTAVQRRTVTKKPVSVEEQVDRQNKEFAHLFHSSLLNKALLARPSLVSDTRRECALKYVGLWGARHVNINSAPRQVLEAALNFGSVADAPRMAEEIIQRRRDKPAADVNELRQAMPGYSTALDDCRTFLTTVSTLFTIRVTACSGVAKATTIVAITKEGDKIQIVAVISD